MPRSARLVIPGLPHHITQRGNNRANVFRSDADRCAYLEILKEYSQKYGLTILGYCLMPNHVHLIAVPSSDDSLAKGIGRTHLRYAQLYNWRNDQCGHFWQGRFFSCPMDEAHYVAAMRYIERNPVRAGIVQLAWDYPWSSALAHLGGKNYLELLDLAAWEKNWSAKDWQEMLLQPDDEEQLTVFRQQTSAGRPLASDLFINSLESLLNRHLRRRSVGRPRK